MRFHFKNLLLLVTVSVVSAIGCRDVCHMAESSQLKRFLDFMKKKNLPSFFVFLSHKHPSSLFSFFFLLTIFSIWIVVSHFWIVSLVAAMILAVTIPLLHEVSWISFLAFPSSFLLFCSENVSPLYFPQPWAKQEAVQCIKESLSRLFHQ